MRDILSAEWLKIRTTASTRYMVLAVVVTALLGVLLAYLWGRTWDGMSPESRTRLTDGSIEETLAPLLQLILAALGVLVVTSEYATGLIRTSLTVAPRRLVVLASKVGVVGVIALVSGVVVTFTTYLMSHGILGRRGFPGYAATFQNELPDLLQASAVVMVVALVGVGMGTVLRSTAGAMFVMAALLFIVPVFVGFLPDPWDDRIGSLMLPQLSDPLIAAGYVIAALAAASTAILRRDV